MHIQAGQADTVGHVDAPFFDAVASPRHTKRGGVDALTSDNGCDAAHTV
jgi:hypothetical protein